MDTKFNLTTKEGVSDALKHFGPIIAFPQYHLAKYMLTRLFGAIKSTTDTEATIAEQKNAAIEIIKAGKEHGVSTLEVTLNQKAGVDFGSDIEGYPIKVMMGKSGNMTIKVTYK